VYSKMQCLFYKGMNTQDTYKAIFDSAPDAVVVIDKSGRIIMANNRVKQLFGYDKDELVGEQVEFLMPDRFAPAHEQHIGDYYRDTKPQEMGAGQELIAKRKDGSDFFVEISLSPFSVKDETLMSAAIRDVTEKIVTQKKLKQSLLSLEKMNKELESFAYITSHDLQEPLHTLLSFASLLHESYSDKLGEEGRKYIDRIAQASQRMSGQIKGLLTHSRIGRNLTAGQVDCNKIIGYVIADLKEDIDKSGAAIHYSDMPVITALSEEIQLLFDSLISNAIKFQEPFERPVVEISAQKNEGAWQFAVKDNGIGIADKHKERVFTIFQRLHTRGKYEGLGIGLAHSRKIVELHGGKIWVDSKPGKGSTFYFTIPITLLL
jgi:PAS domain S-box-containing protein